MKVNCLVCGKEHNVKPCKYKAGTGRYCSRTCAGKGKWLDPDYRAAQMAIRSSGEFIAQMSEIASEMWIDGRLGSDEWRQRHSEIMIGCHADPEFRQAMSVTISEAWRSGRLGDEEWKRANAEGKRIAWAMGKYNAIRNLKVSIAKRGKHNPAWREGASSRAYTYGFGPALKKCIRIRDKFRCVLCGTIESGIAHDVHHVDYNKGNHQPANLVTLCKPCHAKTNYTRESWPDKIRKVMEGNGQ